MTTNLHIREVPDDVHATLKQRAAQRGMSLRGYTIEVLEAHCQLPTMSEWLDRVHERPRVTPTMSAAEAVRLSRDEREDHLLTVLGDRAVSARGEPSSPDELPRP